MRCVRVVLALVFGLAMAGPETHACPVHTPAAASHHQDGGSHEKAAHCTCPQACCPSGISISLPTYRAPWNAAPRPLVVVDAAEPPPLRLAQPKYLLPFALGPPTPLALV